MKTKAIAVAGLVVWGLFSGIVVRAEEDNSIRVIKQALLGAGVGAISSEVSGGKAGTGALVGAGTNVVGSALAELLTNGGNRQAYTVMQPQGYTTVQPFQFYQYQENAVTNYSHNAHSSGFSTGVYPSWPVANQTVVQTTTTTAPVCQPVPQPQYKKWGPRGHHYRHGRGSRQLQRVYDYQGRLIAEYETWR